MYDARVGYESLSTAYRAYACSREGACRRHRSLRFRRGPTKENQVKELEQPQPRGGRRDDLASTPVIGEHLAAVHDATTFMRPSEEDDKTTVVVKRVTQGAVLTVICGVAALVIL